MSADTRLLRWPDQQREDYLRLATALARLRDVAAKARGELVVPVPSGPEEPSDLDRARALLAQRRVRDSAAGAHAELFSDPAWDMLLTLFVADLEGRRLDQATLVEVSRLMPRAAERWIGLLVERAFVVSVERPMLTLAGREFVRLCVGGA